MENKKPYIFKCKSCGGNLIFSPKEQALSCPHCRSISTFDIDKNVVKKPYIQDFDNQPVLESGISSLTCTSCGAHMNMLNGEISGQCPFCGTGNIILKEDIKGLKPDECIPFTIEAADAESSFKKWIKKKWFVPNDLKKQAKADNTKGIYSPCYAFNAQSYSTYSGVLGKHYTTYVGTGKNRRAVIRTRFFNISGDINKDFIDVMTECSPHFDQKVLDKLRPFSLDKRAVYDKSFLSGFSADSYDKDLNTGWKDSAQKMDKELKTAILSKYSYDVVQSLNVNTKYSNILYSYMLLPVYTSGFKYNQKIYNFFVNGNTGRTFGAVPRSPVKIFFAVLFAIALIVATLLLIQNFSPEYFDADMKLL